MATVKQKKAAVNLVGNGGNVTKAMIAAGYSENTANTPQKLTESKGWNELMGDYLSDEELAAKHRELLDSTRVDHLVFPLGPSGLDDQNFSGGKANEKQTDEEEKMEYEQERTTLTDQEIIDMLAEVNCKVRRIVHGETARHVYFWSVDNKARKEALDMAYKLKGKYAPTKSVNLNLEVEADATVKAITKELNEIYKGRPISEEDPLP